MSKNKYHYQFTRTVILERDGDIIQFTPLDKFETKADILKCMHGDTEINRYLIDIWLQPNQQIKRWYGDKKCVTISTPTLKLI